MNTCTHGKELWARCIECEADMTDETKGDGMTLEFARRSARIMHTDDQHEVVCLPIDAWKAIDAHLAAQSAMRVDVTDKLVSRLVLAIDDLLFLGDEDSENHDAYYEVMEEARSFIAKEKSRKPKP